MKFLKYVITAMLLLLTLAIAGCGEDKFVGNWYNRTDNTIGKSVITKEKNKEKTYNDAEYAMGYQEQRYDAGRDANGRIIINFRYTWTDRFIFNVILNEKDGKLYGTYKDLDVNIEYDEKSKKLLGRSSKVPIVIEGINEKDFDVKKVREEIKANITKKFNELKEEHNRNPIMFVVGDIEFIDDPSKVPHPNG